MSECHNHRESLEKLLSGELQEDATEALYRHLEGCADCRELERTHRELALLGSQLPEPEAGELAAVRTAVLEAIDPAPRRGAVLRPSPGRWRALAGPMPALAAAGLAAAVGFLFGLGLGEPESEDAFSSSIQRAAVTHASLADAEDSPFLYTNVRLRQLDGDRVALSFDVTRHLELVRSDGDPLIGEITAQALLGGEAPAQRLAAIEYAEGLSDGRVIEALTAAMLSDPETAVRLRALARLSREPAGPALEQAFLRVLEREASVQMRLLAVDYLTDNGVEPSVLERALEAGRPTPGTAVGIRAANYLTRYTG